MLAHVDLNAIGPQISILELTILGRKCGTRATRAELYIYMYRFIAAC